MTVEAAHPAVATRDVKFARIAVTIVFFLFGINIGLWATHIPILQARLGMDPALLGLVLLAAAAGTFLAQPVAGEMIARTGSRRPLIAFACLSIVALVFAVSSLSVVMLAIGCFLIGAFWGCFNVAMNTQGSEIEKRRGLPTMSSFHAGASLGMLAGALLGSVVIAAGLGNGTGAAIVGAVGILVALVAGRYFLADAPGNRAPAFTLPNRQVIGLGLLAMLAFVAEGGMVDWSALFLKLEKGADESWAALGFGVFTGAMFLMRTVGNQIVLRIGRRNTVLFGGLLLASGLGLAAISPSPILSALCLALAGIGSANIVPVLISAAAQTPGVAPSVAIGAVSTVMTFGFLVGPPLIGFVAQATSLTVGIAVLGLFGLIIAAASAGRRWSEAPVAN